VSDVNEVRKFGQEFFVAQPKNTQQTSMTTTAFNLTSLRDMMQEHSIKQPRGLNEASTTNMTPTTVSTIVKSTRGMYERMTGTRDTSDFGDLTWLTPALLEQPSKSKRLRPWSKGLHGPGATDAKQVPLESNTKRKMLENFRSVLYAAIIHVKDPALQAQWKQAHQGFTKLADELREEENHHLLTRRPSARQEANWVPWPDIRSATAQMVSELEADSEGLDPLKLYKKMQKALVLLLYVNIPPMRNDLARLRFVDGKPSEEEMRVTKSPNYIEVAPDGSMTIVLNAYKNDNRSTSADYDPDSADFVLDNPRRYELKANPVLTKFGFSPEGLGQLLADYRKLIRKREGLFSDKFPYETEKYPTVNPNPYEFLFTDGVFDGDTDGVHADGMESAISDVAYARRLGRLAQKLVGKELKSQMLRTLFCSWLDDQDPSLEERKVVGDWMQHSIEHQMGTYTKRPPPERREIDHAEKKSRGTDEM
jgi:hypothetical protein